METTQLRLIYVGVICDIVFISMRCHFCVLIRVQEKEDNYSVYTDVYIYVYLYIIIGLDTHC